MSADSSGGVRSSAARTAETTERSGADSASPISPFVTTTVLGNPARGSRPRTSAESGVSRGRAEPNSILTRSAVRLPTSSP